MAFQEILRNAVKKFNERVKVKSEYQKIIQKYDGRTVTLNIKDDTAYIFHLSSNRITLEILPENNNNPKDMYVEMDKETFKKVLEERRLNAQDLLRGKIRWKNISLKDVREIKRILGVKSLNFKSKSFT